MDEETRVVVHPGVYNEALVLDRPVSLIGAGMAACACVCISIFRCGEREGGEREKMYFVYLSKLNFGQLVHWGFLLSIHACTCTSTCTCNVGN